jgi:hypothetical protein
MLIDSRLKRLWLLARSEAAAADEFRRIIPAKLKFVGPGEAGLGCRFMTELGC